MNNTSYDEKIIRKYYGENLWHLCRRIFPTILEKEGQLSSILTKYFSPNFSLYEDIISSNEINSFKNYINIISSPYQSKEYKTNKTPKELLSMAGYDLYECLTEKDIQYFKKYYAKGEELCTFNSNRLDDNYVFFAVKKNVALINRNSFPNPKRQDEYGTSVISIQFTKDNNYTLSIKNRYNHTVKNPDATFSNNLDNIIPGLTYAFSKYYNMKQTTSEPGFILDNYIKDQTGKYYKYNYELYGTYYCEDSIIIKNFLVTKLNSQESILIDYFIVDLKNKTISLYDKTISDSFPNMFDEIKKITILKENSHKKIIVTTTKNEHIIIKVDNSSRIIGITNNNIKHIGNNFLMNNKKLCTLEMPKVISFGNNCFYSNEFLTSLSLPSTISIGNNFLCYNQVLDKISMNNLKRVGNNCFYHNLLIKSLSLPALKTIGTNFFYYNQNLEKIFIPNAKELGVSCFYNHQTITTITSPKKKIKKLGKGSDLFDRRINN